MHKRSVGCPGVEWDTELFIHMLLRELGKGMIY